MQQTTNSALHFLVFGLIFFSGATMVCGQPAGWQGKFENRQGVEDIYNPEQGLWEHESTPALKIKRIFSIGKASNKAEKNFGWVQDVATDSAGNIYIWDLLVLPHGRIAAFIRDAGQEYLQSRNEREFETYVDLFDADGYFWRPTHGIGGSLA